MIDIPNKVKQSETVFVAKRHNKKINWNRKMDDMLGKKVTVTSWCTGEYKNRPTIRVIDDDGNSWELYRNAWLSVCQ